jgi:hypothetical protein
VKLRDNLRAIARGTVQRIDGETLPDECYVLLFGYQGPVDSLPVSPGFQEKLKSLTPIDYERYVLVHAVGDEIKELTKWEPGNDPLFAEVPMVIRGNPFLITVTRREQHQIKIDVK